VASILVIPAIDIADGKCVRLKQGDMAQRTVFSNDPAEMALRWQEAGAERIHVVDLDGAVGGQSANLEGVRHILAEVRVPVELGGGLRTRDDVARVLEMGVQWAIMGTSALADPEEMQRCLEEFGTRIIAGVDARNGRVSVRGWTETSKVSAVTLARKLQDQGAAAVIFTDIATDGMLAGPNVESTRAMTEALDIGVIASGGVTALDDVRKLRLLEPAGVIGCIVGRALYSGTLDLREAILAAAG
jgi:phosphoribosylformimino-5-aminoimidazole carboxamide ribotide isomerase